MYKHNLSTAWLFICDRACNDNFKKCNQIDKKYTVAYFYPDKKSF